MSLFLICTLLSRSQGAFLLPGNTKSSGMAGVNTCFSGSYALTSNPAGTAWLSGYGAIAQGESRYLLTDLKSLNAGAGYGKKENAFSVALEYFGFESFNQQKVGLGYGRKLAKNFAIGARFDYYRLTISEYGNSNSFTFDVGLQYRLSPHLIFGTHAINPIRAQLVEGEYLPSILKLGILYKTFEKLEMAVDVEKQLEQALRLRTGIQYTPHPSLLIRAGIATHPFLFSFGAGLKLRHGLEIGLSSEYHQQLGFTPAAGVVIHPMEKN